MMDFLRDVNTILQPITTILLLLVIIKLNKKNS